MLRDHQLLAKVTVHAAKLMVDKLQGAAEIFGTHTHERLHHIHLRLTATTGDDITIETLNQFAIGLIGLIKILDYQFAWHT